MFASAGSRGKRTGQCGQSGQAWLSAREACGVVVLLSVAIWWRVGARVVQAARKLIEVDPSARVVAGK